MSETIIDALYDAAGRYPNRQAYAFLGASGEIADRITYSELLAASERWAKSLTELCPPASRVLIVFNPGLGFVAALYGCLRAGMTAVPAYPPTRRGAKRFEQIVRNCAAAAVIAGDDIRETVVQTLSTQGLDLQVVPLTESVSPMPGMPRPEDIAVLQYTSGSTFEPKGVILTHANIIHNQRMIASCFGHDSNSRILGWLPVYHDMGLIGIVMQPIYLGATCFLMAPAQFLRSPLVWLKAIARHRIQTSGGPNFAYDLCVRQFDKNDCIGLDLSSWRVAFNGAEPVHACTLQTFADTFAPYGFSANAFLPCYGLAEATLLVSGKYSVEPCPHAISDKNLRRSITHDGNKEYMSSGAVLPGVELRIVSLDDTSLLKDGDEGEIWIRGESIARGYFNNEAATNETFIPILAGETGPWLRTGDLGVICNKRLYVTGRIKDVIITYGLNVYPQDIEHILPMADTAIITGSAAAYAITSDEGEAIGIAVEIDHHRREHWHAIGTAVARLISADLGLTVHSIALLRPGTLPKTTSGKVQRQLTRQKIDDGTLVPYGVWRRNERRIAPTASPTLNAPITSSVLLIVAEAAKLDPATLTPRDKLRDLGIDSVTLIELRETLARVCHVHVSLDTLLEDITLGDLEKIRPETQDHSRNNIKAHAGTQSGVVPLSLYQSRFAILEQMTEDASGGNTVTARVAFDGRLDPILLQRALEDVVMRHKTLWLTLPDMRFDQGLLQSPRNVALSNLTEEGGEGGLTPEAFLAAPFTLTSGPLYRFGLMKTAVDEYKFFIHIHHIVADGWSIRIFLRDLMTYYDAGLRFTRPDLPSVPDYIAFAARQRTADFENDKQAFQTYLAGAPDLLTLPCDGPYEGAATLEIPIPPDLSLAIQKAAKRMGLSPAALWLTAYSLVLSRLSNQDDLLVGVPIIDRDELGYADCVGLMLNVLPVRLTFDQTASLGACARLAGAAMKEVLRLRRTPLEQVLEAVQPRRDPHRTPLFQVLFNYLPNARIAGKTGNLCYHLDPVLDIGSKFDITLYVAEAGEDSSLAFAYRAKAFNAARMQTFARQVMWLARGLSQQPNTSAWLYDLYEHYPSVLPLPSEPMDLQGWPGPIHNAVARHASMAPDRIALIGPNASLNYRELNQLGNGLARRLAEMGVIKGANVTLIAPRHASLVWGVLGILKAGGVFTIIDMNYPAERINTMLEMAQPKVILSVGGVSPPWANTPVVALPDIGDVVALQTFMAAEDPQIICAPDDAACLTFTSGSSGIPSCVLGRHAGLTAFLPWQTDVFSFSPQDIVSLLSGLSHDPLQRDLCTAWWSGGSLVVPEADILSHPEKILTWLRAQNVTIANLTPALTRLVAASFGTETILSDLRLIFLVGETLKAQDVRTLRGFAPSAEVVNLYGATETQRALTHHRIPPLCEVSDPVPLGTSPPGMQLLIRRTDGRPADIGEYGEIWVRSPFIALGYASGSGDASRFTKDGDGVPMYRTGDFGRYTPDGTVTFAGRNDRQVNIRGYRVELQEIENAAENIFAVVQARALWDEEQETLILYLVMPEREFDENTVRSALSLVLPQYMTPSHLIWLAAIPLTPNGKINDKALPRPSSSQQRANESFSSFEERLANLWRNILHVDEISRYDSFFALGGHSLRAAELQVRIATNFGVDISLRDILGSSDLMTMAKHIAKSTSPTIVPTIVADTTNRYHPFPLNDIQRAYWIGRQGAFQIGDVGSHSYYEFDCKDLDLQRFEEAWNAVVEAHEMLRAHVTDDAQQVILCATPRYTIACTDLRGMSPEAQAKELLNRREIMSRHVFDPQQWPLFRLESSRIDESTTRLHFSFDFITGDAWSWNVIAPELCRAYADAVYRPQTPDLSFRDYVLAESAWQKSLHYSAALAYWRQQINNIPPGPALPLAIDPEKLRGARFKRRTHKVAAATWMEIKKKARAASLSPSVVLLTAYAETLNFWSRSPQFTVNLTFFDRRPWHPDINKIVGDFTSIILLALDFTGRSTFSSRCQEVQNRLWECLDHRDVSGVRVMREMNMVHAGEAGMQIMPVVFTSKLGVADTAVSAPVEEWLGNIAYGVSQTPQVWIDGQVAEEIDGGLRINWDCVDALFPDGMLDDMFSAFIVVIEALGSNAEAMTSSDLVQLSERDQALYAACNATSTSVPDGVLHDPWLRANKRDFKAASIITPEGVQLTRGDINSRAEAVATFLRSHETEYSKPVAILMDKGWEQIVAALGCLLAGMPYMPLDPNQGAERIEAILAATNTRYILHQDWIVPPNLSDIISASVTEISTKTMPLESATVNPDAIAYVIFTSGSTGIPQGVMIDHRGALNTCTDINTMFAVTERDSVFGISALGFDLSVYDIFGVLGVGGRLVLPHRDHVRDPAHWLEQLEAEQVTIWNSAPPLMQMLVQYCEDQNRHLPSSLRLVMLSGDWIPTSLPDRIRALSNGKLQIVSLGGATEASIWSIYHIIGDERHRVSVPYGKAMANQTFHVLDDQLRARPLHVTGHLYIGGTGLALGYWNNLDLTHKRFITHPATGERLYRTGDLGRWMPNGEIEFQGREDFQVKVQGYRVELGEIEAALTAIESIKQAVVTVHGEKTGPRRLVAYVQSKNEVIDIASITSTLRQKLPSYMVPAAVIQLIIWPTTANGKLDRKSLPAPQFKSATNSNSAMSAITAAQRAVLEAFAIVLRLSQVPIDGNFFELGGTSMETIGVQGELRRRLNVDVSVADLFRYASPRTLGDHIEQSYLEKNKASKGYAQIAAQRATDQRAAHQRLSQNRRGK